MGTVRNKNRRFQAQFRRRGAIPISKTFANKKDATVWVRGIEARLDAGEINVIAPKAISLGDIMQRYSQEITPHKKRKRARAKTPPPPAERPYRSSATRKVS